MAAFKYKAISRDGSPVNGVIEAYDEFEAVGKIKETCRIVTSISETAGKEGLLERELFPTRASHKALSLLCSQFSIILSAGLPVVRAVELIAQQTTDKQLKKLLKQVSEDVAVGYSLAQSLENKGSKLLPATFIETLRAGEESGTLDLAFKKLHVYYDKSHKIRSKVRSAMMYPIFLSVLAVVVTAFIMGFTMPVFIEMFAGMDMELPLLTRILISISNFCGKFWPLILIVVLGLAFGIKFYSATEAGRLRMAKLRLRLPAVGRVSAMKGASQLANTMSTLLAAGLPVIRAVSATARSLDNYYLGTRLGAVVVGLEEGRPLGDCLEECGCFPDMLVEMAAVGDDSGSLEETLETISIYYDNEVTVATTRALGMIQPAVTVVMGLIIGLLVIALYLPMFTMYNGM